jgi:hypothetical protein
MKYAAPSIRTSREFSPRRAAVLRAILASTAALGLMFGGCVSDTPAADPSLGRIAEALTGCGAPGNASQVTPTVVCTATLASGQLVAILGYTSAATTPFTVPIGEKNHLASFSSGFVPPTAFVPGTNIVDGSVPFDQLPWTIGETVAPSPWLTPPTCDVTTTAAGSTGHAPRHLAARTHEFL